MQAGQETFLELVKIIDAFQKAVYQRFVQAASVCMYIHVSSVNTV